MLSRERFMAVPLDADNAKPPRYPHARSGVIERQRISYAVDFDF